ncbi:bifunctional helix-turn-helix transcriptional regulator/GNAT family N-acetyltransferase [Photobacterium rosenbergii]|uniref:Bifunctional helix-turn-helix transcriptional regulator/GNAT family N-acetyltransferase n=1 Tax=Photobacterium rosenbergii TaxID=294936 RepID=A0ABU3ZLL2_9GAMM|nr:bifunctional helix-turn-helix transcriptional regulator/GNAT family N-acetyltransferase [Photobacterium rosenbergii]MDV5171000.1 bifunctional helix-turn-helix transcriptional regulator/GNAT family N-acetyltransferase [Photobacterium rosenbergii]
MDAASLRAQSRLLVRELGMLDRQCGSLDITPVQAHALIELEEQPLSVNQLASRLKVDKSNASRTTASLLNAGYLTTQADPEDGRKQLSSLSPQGQALLSNLNHSLNLQVADFMAQLDQDEIANLAQSLQRYTKAIQANKQQEGYQLRLLTPLDNAAMAAVVRRVSAEHGLTADKGYGVADPTLDSLSEVYSEPRSAFWIVEKDNRILGGGGIAPLAGEEGVCELQKMYFLPELRGKGFARRIAATALKYAREQGFKACYLETTASLQSAIKLYQSLGFVRIPHAMGQTGHDACEVRMLKTL